ncbi:Aldehyde/histidinol dehydrogenase [Aspergillus granulosus]|uniref:aldehyde dehydrogenase (NAD(+)) n=1 Tax=Aspergillus granulosus TaxID=176169 RepID=A0ABR4HDT7_9EURO
MKNTAQILHLNGRAISLSAGFFINGRFVDSKQHARLDVEDPATGKTLIAIVEGREEDVDEAVRVARQVFDAGEWSAPNPTIRGAILHKLADLMEQHKDDLIALAVLQPGFSRIGRNVAILRRLGRHGVRRDIFQHPRHLCLHTTRADRGVWANYSLELPHDDVYLEDRPGVDLRTYRRGWISALCRQPRFGLRQEIFGPVVAIAKFSSEAEAIKQANNTTDGLAAACHTKNYERAIRVTNALRAGTTWVNMYNFVHWSTPFWRIQGEWDRARMRRGGSGELHTYQSRVY